MQDVAKDVTSVDNKSTFNIAAHQAARAESLLNRICHKV